MTLDQIEHFRQLGSRTAGHPEYGHAAGIETTTGPLGQGLANSVGFALAERIMNAALRRRPRRPPHLCDCRRRLPDGRHQPGGASSLAGHLKLNKLIVHLGRQQHLDRRHGVARRFHRPARALRRLRLEHDRDRRARSAMRSPRRIEQAQKSDRPTLIAAKTIIGCGAPTKAGTNKAHGSPLGAEEIAGARKFFSWDYPPFEVPADIIDAWRKAGTARSGKRADWQKRLAAADAEPARRVRAPHRGRAAGGLRCGDRRLQEEARRRQAEGRHPQILRDGAGGDQRRGARDDRRLGRPDRLQQHQDQPDQGDLAPATTATATSISASASTAWRRR